jgi:translation initiation factor IF-3
MKHLSGLVSIAQALRYTFFQSSQTRRVSLHRLPRRYPLPRWGLQARFLFRPSARKPGLSNLPHNEEIESDIIQLVDANGALETPTRKSNVLFSLKRNEDVLVQVAAPQNERPAVCKIMSIKEVRELEKAKSKAAHVAKTSTKQIELNWAIDPHDLTHRLKSLASFIEKGRTVEITLTQKKRKRPPTDEEVKHLIERVLNAIEEVNAVQTKGMEGQPGKTLLLTVAKKVTQKSG